MGKLDDKIKLPFQVNYKVRLVFFYFILLISFHNDSIFSQDISHKYNRKMYCLAIDNDTVWLGGKSGLFNIDLAGHVLNKYTVDDNLAGNTVYAITKDKNGCKWIGTSNGITVFYGSVLQTFHQINGVAVDTVSVAKIDSSENLWFGTSNNGIWKFNGNVWVNYNTSNSNIASNKISVITFEGKDTVWVGTKDNGVCILYSNNWIHFNTFFTNISGIAIDNKGKIFISSGSTISDFKNNYYSWDFQTPLTMLYSNNRGEVFYSDSYNLCKINFTDNTFILDFINGGQPNTTAIDYDKDGNLWYINDKLHKIESANTIDIYVDDNQIQSNFITCGTFDSSGDQWFGSNDNGVSKFDGITWKNFNTSNGLSYHYVTSIKTAKNGDIWVGTFEGINKISNSIINSYKPPLINDYNVQCIEQDNKNNIWIGTSAGAAKFNGTTWTKYYSEQGFTSQLVYSIVLDSSGILWFGAANGLYSYNGTAWTKYANIVIGNQHIYNIAVDLYNNKWIRCDSGLIKFDGTNWKHITTPQDWNKSTSNEQITFDSKNNMWTPFSSTLFWKMDSSGWFSFKFDYVTNIKSILVDSNNNKWFCTSDGVYFLKDTCKLPDSTGIIIGSEAVCQGETVNNSIGNINLDLEKIFSVRWIFPGDTEIIVNNYSNTQFKYPNDAKSGNLYAQYSTLCGTGPILSKNITVKPLPPVLSGFTGSNKVCSGQQNVEYKVNPDSVSLSYSWYLPQGFNGTSISNAIKVSFSDTAVNSGVIKVRGNNNCGVGPLSSLYVTVLKKALNIDSVTGDKTICSNKLNIKYYTNKDSINEAQYTWELPEGVSGLNGSNSIQLNFDTAFKSGLIKIRAYNQCGSNESQIQVKNSIMVPPIIKTKWDDLLICPNLYKIYSQYQWFFNGSKLQSSTEQYCIAKEQGNYKVFVYNNDGCIDSSQSILYSGRNVNYSITPNPAKSSFKVVINNNVTGKITIAVTNSQGIVLKQFETIKTDKVFSFIANINELPEGIYSVNVNKNGISLNSSQLVIIK